MTISYQRDVASSTAGGFTRLLFKWKASVGAVSGGEAAVSEGPGKALEGVRGSLGGNRCWITSN